MVKSRNWKSKSEVIAELGNEEIFIVNDIDYNDSHLMERLALMEREYEK